MNNQQFLEYIATKAAHKLHLPLGEIDPAQLINLYSLLSVLMGDDEDLMVHWLNTHNKHLDFIPATYLTDERQMTRMINYLEGLVGE